LNGLTGFNVQVLPGLKTPVPLLSVKVTRPDGMFSFGLAMWLTETAQNMDWPTGTCSGEHLTLMKTSLLPAALAGGANRPLAARTAKIPNIPIRARRGRIHLLVVADRRSMGPCS
jgi:hypothetical protein